MGGGGGVCGWVIEYSSNEPNSGKKALLTFCPTSFEDDSNIVMGLKYQNTI